MSIRILGVALLGVALSSCGSKDEVDLTRDQVGSNRNPQPVYEINPQPREKEKEGASTQIQIACENRYGPGEIGIYLPNSQQRQGVRVPDYLRRPASQFHYAPSILSIRNNIAQILFFSGSGAFLTTYDFASRTEGERTSISISSGSASSVHRYIGVSKTRVAVAAPDRTSFLVSSGSSLQLRTVEAPTRNVRSLGAGGGAVNLRWEPLADGQSEIFGDSGSRQIWIKLNRENRVVKSSSAPKSLRGSTQVGLRRFDSTQLTWLEWSERASIVRLWNPETDEVKNFNLPAISKFGPGFALVSKGNTKWFSFQSREGIYHFQISGTELELAEKVTYPERVQEAIRGERGGDYGWNPGAIYSGANDTQLFTVLPNPAVGGRALYALDDGTYFRQLGHDECLNPDFYPEFTN